MSSPTQRVQVLQSEAEDLKTYLSGLSPEAWSQPSACDHWTVADVVAHIAGALESYTGNVKRGLQGDTSPAAGRQPPRFWKTASAEERAQRAEEAAQRVINYRESLGDQLLPTLHQNINGFNQLLDSLRAQDWDKLCYHGRGEIPIPTQVTYAILEVCLHRWDIQSKLEPGAHLSGEGLQYLLEHLEEYMHWAFIVGPDFAESRHYRFQLTGAVSDVKDIVIDGQQARLADPHGSSVDAVFRCDAEDFLLLVCGRTKFPEAVANGILVPEGDAEVPGEFTRWSQAI
jgi:uncharacterized protein (TIGR03083 family)